MVNHWLSLIGGALVSVALLFWGQYGGASGQIPGRVWWSGMLAGFFLAAFLAWNEERGKADALAIRRPEYNCINCGFQQSQTQDGKLIDVWLIRFDFENPSGLRASKMRRRVVVLDRGSGSWVKTSDTSSSDGNDIFGTYSVKTRVNTPQEEPLRKVYAFFCVFLEYRDARTDVGYQQRFYFKWKVDEGPHFDLQFRNASADDREEIERFLGLGDVVTFPKAPVSA